MGAVDTAVQTCAKPKGMALRFPPSFWPHSPKRLPTRPSASPLARRVLDLYAECDRVDAMPANAARDRVLADLLTRIRRFECETPAEAKTVAFWEAMAVAG